MSKYRRGNELPRKEEIKFGLQFLAIIHKKTRNDRIPKCKISETTMKTLVNATVSFSIPITFV